MLAVSGLTVKEAGMDEPRNQLRPVAEEPVRARTRDDEEDLKLLKQEYANAMAECRRFEQLAASNRLRAYMDMRKRSKTGSAFRWGLVSVIS